MRISSVNNYYNPTFGISLSKNDAKKLFDTVHNMDEGIPKLYTVLELLASKQPDAIAELKYLKGINLSRLKPVGYQTAASRYNCWQLRIVNGALIEQGPSVYEVLYSVATSQTTPGNKQLEMSKDEFEILCQKNRLKTETDILTLLI